MKIMLYIIYMTVLSSRFNKNIWFEYGREIFLQLRMKKSYSSPAEEEIDTSKTILTNLVVQGFFSNEASVRL